MLLFRRVTLVFLCLTLVFTLGMPNEVEAWSLFGDGKPKPSILPAEKVDITPGQAATEAPAGPLEVDRPKKDTTKVKELPEKRTAYSKTYVNKDGSKTLTYSPLAKSYKKDGKWLDLNPTISDDSFKTKGTLLDEKDSLAGKTQSFKLKTGDVNTALKPFNDGIDVAFKDTKFVLKPQDARNVRPQKQTFGKSEIIVYKNAWKNADVEYELHGPNVKETLILRNKSAQTEYVYKVEGGVKLIPHPTEPGALAIEGVDPNEFYISPLTVNVNNQGVISSQVAKWQVENDIVKLNLDADWFNTLKKEDFPVAIDPSFTNNVGGPVGNFKGYKSDGYSCNSDVCGVNVGQMNDAGTIKRWRSAFYIPIDQLAGKKLLYAQMHLVKMQRSYYTGVDGNRYFTHTWAPCLGYNCIGSGVSNGLVDWEEWVDVTNTVQTMVNGGGIGNAWFMLNGEEYGNYISYKLFDPSYLEMNIIYDTPTPVATPIEPADKQVTVSTQPTLRVNPVTDADGEAVEYFYQVSTGHDAETGAVVNSGWTPATQWTVPDGILQDGTTYYWHVYTIGKSNTGTRTNPNWVRSFKLNLRTGKDSTQAYDTVGPVGIDLATGNATTSNTTHSMNALGGNIGLDFNYASPAKTQKGLTVDYWNVAANYSGGVPTGPSDLTRIDEVINNNYSTGNPGGSITNDWFYARWKGNFVAPTTGSYMFGGNHDDAMVVKINGNIVYNNGGCYTGTCYDQAVSLTAGQVVPLEVNYMEATGAGYVKLFVKGAVSEQIVPHDWLRTEAKAQPSQYGLTGRYYTDDGSHSFPLNSNDPSRFMMARNDPQLSFNWGNGGPAEGMQPDNFMAKWTGYITVPKDGSYTFGENADDGVRVKLNNGLFGAENTVLDSWNYTGTTVWGSAVNLTKGQQIPITIEYHELSGPASFSLLMKGPLLSTDGEALPAKWLTPKASVLPDAWRLGVDVDGNVGYERLRVVGTNVVLEDSTRATHEYTWTGALGAIEGGYKPPVNENGQLTKGTDNTYTLLDTDGRTYIFDAEGRLKSLTTATDDRQPSSLKYEYAGDPSRLMKIVDGVTNTRYGTLHYKGDNEEGNCSVPSGFDSAPDGMLCAFKTSDGKLTKFYYREGQLSRIEKPGADFTDYGYDGLGRVTSIRNSLANDAIDSNVRTDDANLLTELSYDQLSRTSAVKTPAPTNGATRMNHTFEYLTGATQLHIVGTPEPNGFSKRVEYDNLLRTTKETNVANLSGVTEWDSAKDLQLSSTDATGLKSTTVYDALDRPINSYGPAPAAWFDGVTREPLSAYVAQVPRAQTGYDEGVQGLNVAAYNNKKLTGTPKLYTTAFNNIPNASYGLDLVTGGVTPTDGASIRATGKMLLSEVGNHNFRAWHTDGMRLYVDNQLVVDNWVDGSERFSQSGTFNNTIPNRWVDFRVDVYRAATTGRVFAQLFKTAPGGSEQADISGLFTPGYNLITSQTTYDAQLGNTTAKTNYSRPEYGLVDSTNLDSTGMNLQAANTYETPGTAYLRQTSKTLPGGGTTTYQHYGAEETRDNPCTPVTEVLHQAGRPKGKVEADPDGTGSQVGRSSETVYDESGQVVATKYNNDPWTCTTYDARGRVTQTAIPEMNGEAGRTITNTWIANGNPFEIHTTDNSGTLATVTDLLGRTTYYRDVHWDETWTTYDDLGRLTQRTSPVGVETFIYDNFDKLIEQKLDGTTIAVPHYDQYGRLASVDYPTAGQQKLGSITRDNNGRTTGYSYTLGDGSTASDSVGRSQSGQIISESRIVGSNTLNSTFNYDKASRLTGATIGNNTYAYGFGAQDASCAANTNPNAGKNSNRTSMTINGQSTTYCYDYADRLVSSSDQSVNGTQYDSHGNMKRIGVSPDTLDLHYDTSDRTWGLVQYNGAGDGKAIYYNRDVQGRIVYRESDNITGWNWSLTGQAWYGFTSADDTPDFVRDSNWNIVEKYVALPGGALLTLRPNETDVSRQAVHSLPNIHGDMFVTTDKSGTMTGNFDYDPFGNPLITTPDNTGSGSFNWVGRAQKQTETGLVLHPIQMGARVYFPTLGRFAQVDPIEGGALNNYVYAMDPVNQYDLTGQNILLKGFQVIQKALSALKPVLQIILNTYTKVASRAPMILQSPTPAQVISRTPPQAQNVVRQILSQGASSYRMAPFENRKFPLPTISDKTLSMIKYTEHDLRAVTDPKLRGLERIVTGSDGSIWYTADHYATFTRIK